MRCLIRKGYTFDDVALVPQYNNVPSRTEPSLETWLTKSKKLSIPLLASNMDTVISEALADVLLSVGSFPVFHRFADFSIQKRWVERYRERSFVSSGILPMHIDQTRELLDLGAAGVCVDVAHGHSDKMLQYIEAIKKHCPNKEVIAGNVCTAMGYHDLVNAGADAVKVGIGPGSACKTRVVTGFGMPQMTAIFDCAEVAERLRVPLIADGGIRSSRDVVLALAAGASTVMIGKLFALTEESAAPKKEGKAKYRGQASEDFQTDYYGGIKPKTVAEGIDFWAPISGSALALIEKLTGGLRSAMTYGGAKNIKELQRKAEFVEVTPHYLTESFPRP